ncbi:sulfatase family protein [Halopiger xanaduensis]|uniref:N-sulfoglucosamine sulfohydrolase n=1 Tax=Halopiger xanaduensis (strain DSM 18323 / JCM 14033 / SH-6) TaxID=797210 RepID=F8DAA6_HALXS|nr:sulfatase [Halopiger xanaduensis]AEH38187.1 N-sulfoglucosamine sulfohydrolase [Halopiger xanaduensis SH-6]
MAQSQPRPNIVLVHCHDLGTYLGCYGAAVDTPRIDAFAADGVRFDRHFVTAPQCSPSRSSLMTGRHPHQNGMLGLAHAGWEIDEDEQLLPELLGAAGYETHLFGLQHITEYPDRLGYDRIHSENSLTADGPPSVHESARAREVAADFADALAAGGLGEPFFASVGFFEVHRMEETDGFGFADDRYETPSPDDVDPLEFLPDDPGIRSDIAEIQGMVEALDDGVGTVLDALEDAGLTDETLVVFTTEHGLAMPRAKGTCFDPGIEAAFAVRYPAGFDGERVEDALVSNVDVFATLLEIADAPAPEKEIAGESFASLLREDGTYEPRDRIFAGMTWHDRYNPVRAIRTDRWKYIRNFWNLPDVYLTNDIYRSDAGREVRDEFYDEQRSHEELYDLEDDPLERENLLAEDVPDDSEIADVHDRLRTELGDWMASTGDPLLDEPVLPEEVDDAHPWAEDGRH